MPDLRRFKLGQCIEAKSYSDWYWYCRSRMVVFQEDNFLKVTEVSRDRGDLTEVDLSDDLCAIVTYVDLSFNSLTSLWGLERFNSLQILILDNNDLGDDIELPQLPGLHELSLNKNNIVNLDGLLSKITSCTPEIVYLSLLGNPACPTEMENSSYTERDYQEYRWKVSDRLPKLLFLDSSPVVRRENPDQPGGRQVGPLDMELIEELFPTTTVVIYGSLPLPRTSL